MIKRKYIISNFFLVNMKFLMLSCGFYTIYTSAFTVDPTPS